MEEEFDEHQLEVECTLVILDGLRMLQECQIALDKQTRLQAAKTRRNRDMLFFASGFTVSQTAFSLHSLNQMMNEMFPDQWPVSLYPDVFTNLLYINEYSSVQEYTDVVRSALSEMIVAHTHLYNVRCQELGLPPVSASEVRVTDELISSLLDGPAA